MDVMNKNLLKNMSYVDGEWINAKDGSSSEILNPATSESLGFVPNCGSVETIAAIEAATKAQSIWSKTDAKERSSVLKNLHRLVLENQEDLAKIITLEGGKPISESIGEITYAASFFEWFSEEAKRVYGDVIPAHQHDRRTLVIKQPIGVVGCITPWNFPSAMLARKIAPAIAVGCSVVAKPAPETSAAIRSARNVPAGTRSKVSARGSRTRSGGTRCWRRTPRNTPSTRRPWWPP